MNSLHGAVKERAEAFVSNFPVQDTDGCKKAFDILIQRVANRTGLSLEDLAECNKLLHGSSENRGTFDKILSTINKESRKLSGISNDVSIVQTVADLVFYVYKEQPFGTASEPIGLLLSNYLMGCANRAFMIFQKSDIEAVRKAAQNQNSLRLWVADRYQQAYQRGERVLLPQKFEGADITYGDAHGKVRVQWNELVKKMDEWRISVQ